MMQDKKMDPMQEALMRKKGKSLDLEILLGGKPIVMGQGEMKQGNDLAPPREGEGEESQEMPEVEVKINPEMGEEESEDDSALMQGMSDYDKSSMMSRKPRGLGDRARMEALQRSKK